MSTVIEVQGWQEAKAKLDNLIDGLKGKVLNETAEAAGLVFERGMKLRCPVGRTGLLRQSIHYKPTGMGRGEVGPTAPHAFFVEFGTGMHSELHPPHRIYPIHGDVLAWTSYKGRGLKGKTEVVVASTAGMVGRPFVRPTYIEDREKAARAAGRVLQANLERASKL